MKALAVLALIAAIYSNHVNADEWKGKFFITAKVGVFLRNQCTDCFYPDGDVPTQFEGGYEQHKGNWSRFVEIEHESNLFRGWPFNKQRERNAEKLNFGVTYRF